ncbi:hypothetical protein AB0B44_43340, partial [Streptomyces sp. NPDC041003]
MSDTQGSHRRAGPVPEAYGAEPQAWTAGTADPGATLRDPDPGVPGPRAGSRRAGRRRRGADTAGGPGRPGAATRVSVSDALPRRMTKATMAWPVVSSLA